MVRECSYFRFILLSYNLGDYYHGDWFIQNYFYTETLDKIFEYKDGIFHEFTGRFNVNMIQSYSKFHLKDRNGMDLNLLPIFESNRQVNNFVNDNFLDDLDGL